jgi:hypothetical protein
VIHAVAHQVAVALLDDVADMDADTEFDALVGRALGVPLYETVLHLDCAADGVHGATKFDDAPVAGALDDAAVMHSDGRVDQIAAKGPKPCENAIFVRVTGSS